MPGVADLPRVARLRSAADFSALRAARGRAGSTYFHVRYDNNALDTARLGLAVSRRVSKRAVQRNRIKRLARETFRRVRGDLACVDILVIARPVAAQATSAQLLQDLAQLWKRIQPLKDAAMPGTMSG
jgi:ribonuclease P protein component